MRAGSVPVRLDVRCVETPFMASHPLGAQPRHDIRPSRLAVRAVRDAMNRVSTWRTSRADGGTPLLPRASVRYMSLC